MAAEVVRQARVLLRTARAGTLATQTDGQPFASLVTPACAPDLSILLLLSELSDHTRHLRREPRCSLLVAGAPEGANPQTTPRLTVTGTAEPSRDNALKARWLALHPYAAFYADFSDFGLWQIGIGGALWVGGFGKAARLRAAALLPQPGAVASVAEAEAAMMAEWNAADPGALSRIAERAGGEPGNWRVVALDVDGCDLGNGERVLRVHWSAPVKTTDELRREFVALARDARPS